ncbi:hypothetical protein Tco_0108873 [Tanacetum coccineum]
MTGDDLSIDNSVLISMPNLMFFYRQHVVQNNTANFKCKKLHPGHGPSELKGPVKDSYASEVQGTDNHKVLAKYKVLADHSKTPNDIRSTDALKHLEEMKGLLDLYSFLNRRFRMPRMQTLHEVKPQERQKGASQSDIEEEKDASNVKSGDTEELDLEEIQSTARQSATKRLSILVACNLRTQQPIQASDPKEKGKEILIEEPKKKKLSLQQIRALETTNDEEVARKIQAEWDAEEERKSSSWIITFSRHVAEKNNLFDAKTKNVQRSVYQEIAFKQIVNKMLLKDEA